MSNFVYLGYSENSKNEDEIKAAADLAFSASMILPGICSRSAEGQDD